MDMETFRFLIRYEQEKLKEDPNYLLLDILEKPYMKT